MKAIQVTSKLRKKARAAARSKSRAVAFAPQDSPLVPLPDDPPFLKVALKLAKPRPDLPADYALNLDHYLHGTHKQRPQRGRWLNGRGSAKKPFTSAQAKQFNDRLDAMAAGIGELPPDLAKNHDHYIHGHPKR